MKVVVVPTDEEIVIARACMGDDCGRQRLKIWHLRTGEAIHLEGVALQLAKFLAQSLALHLQSQILGCQLLVDGFEISVGQRIVIDTVDAYRSTIGSSQPHASLVMVEAEEQEQAHRLKYQKDEEVVIFAKKLKKTKHERSRLSLERDT